MQGRTERSKNIRIAVYRSEGKICGALAKRQKPDASPCSLNLSWTPVITAWPNKNFLLDMKSSEEPRSGRPFLCNLKVLMTSKLGDSQYSLRSVTFSRIVVSFPFFSPSPSLCFPLFPFFSPMRIAATLLWKTCSSPSALPPYHIERRSVFIKLEPSSTIGTIL